MKSFNQKNLKLVLVAIYPEIIYQIKILNISETRELCQTFGYDI